MQIPVHPIDRLDLRFEPRVWPFAVERRGEIDAHFSRLRARNPALWNGRVLLMHRRAMAERVLHGAYLETDFASFIAWRDFGFPDRAMVNCFPMAALQASDGAYLLGVMAGHTANAGQIYFAAGTPDPADIVDGMVDLAGGVMRELAEETGLVGTEVEVSAGWTLVDVGTRLALMKVMRAREDAVRLRARILDHLAADAQAELSDIRIVRGPADVDPARMPPWITAFFGSIWT
jgi:hypothetical protein